MKVKGTITKVLQVRTGTSKKGKTWAAQQVILETDDSSKSEILLEVFGQKEIEEYALNEGDKVVASFEPKVQEFNGRYFGKNSVTSVEHQEVVEP